MTGSPLEDERGKLGRKLWHLGGGLLFPLLAFFIPRVTLLIAVGVVTLAFIGWETSRFASPKVNKLVVSLLSPFLKREERTSALTGSTWLLIATLIAFLAFAKEVAIAALLFLAVGDFASWLAGKRLGRTKVLRKSLEGSLSFLASCLLVTGLLVYLGEGFSGPLLCLGAVVATLTELLPLPVDDNFSIPIASGVVMTLVQLI